METLFKELIEVAVQWRALAILSDVIHKIVFGGNRLLAGVVIVDV